MLRLLAYDNILSHQQRPQLLKVRYQLIYALGSKGDTLPRG